MSCGGEKPHQEERETWTFEQLEVTGYSVIAAKRFTNRYKWHFVDSQIDMCAPRRAKIVDRGLADALAARGEALRAEALAHVARAGYATASTIYWRPNPSDRPGTDRRKEGRGTKCPSFRPPPFGLEAGAQPDDEIPPAPQPRIPDRKSRAAGKSGVRRGEPG